MPLPHQGMHGTYDDANNFHTPIERDTCTHSQAYAHLSTHKHDRTLTVDYTHTHKHAHTRLLSLLPLPLSLTGPFHTRMQQSSPSSHREKGNKTIFEII